MATGDRPRVAGLDAVRAIAITMVVAWHFTPFDLLLEREHDRLAILSRGVDLFFVLSGYLVGGIALREVAPATAAPGAVARFWTRRWYRTLPAYVATVGLYGITLAFPHRASDEGFPWLYLVFLQSYVLGLPEVFGHSWTLAVEEHFYLALPLLIVASGPAGRRTAGRVALAVALVGGGLAALRIGRQLAGAEVNVALSHLRADGLAAGVLLACAGHGSSPPFASLRRHRHLARLATLVLVIAAFALDYRGSPFTQTAIALAFGALVALAAAGDPGLHHLGACRPVATLARLSYAVYLVHQLANRSIQVVLFGGSLETWGEAAAHVGLSLAATAAAAWVLHRGVEQPFLRLRDRRAAPLRGDAAGL